jgi:UDP:flavonoid glycosyltransferase YjiC (YdhE family)
LGPDEQSLWADAQPLRPTTPGLVADPALVRRIARLPHARTVFVTLGTVYGGNTAALVAAVQGLQAHAVNLVVALGAGGDAARIESCGEHVLVESFVPLASVLAVCSAVVSQGGSGVMLGALAQGLPQLMLPQGADQFRNAELCTATGAALALAPQEASPAAIGSAVGRLLTEGRFASAARRLGDQIAAMPDADSVLTALSADHR